MVLQKSVVRLQGLVDSAVEVVRPIIDKCEQALEVRVPAEDVWVEVDAVRLSQVLGNLLNNASKFTPRGGSIAIEARVAPEGLEISVADDGVGIAPELLGSVFDLFSQADSSLDRAQGGLGIGLSLVKGLVEMHGGVVTARSAGPGKGSRFSIRLPLAVITAPGPVPKGDVPAIGEHARRVLVVEDSADAAEAMELLLNQLGHDVRVVNDGARAVEAARAFRPDVILLDIGLPGVDGYELARRFRALDETSGARVIAVTGYGQPSDRARSSAAGFDHHLVKPVDPAKLAAAIRAPLAA